MKKLLLSAFAASTFALGAFAATPYYGAFKEYKPGAISPEGHLREFLERERDGLLGHRERLGYPFDGDLWASAITNIHFTEGVYNGADEDVSGRGDWWNSGAWWPYEQSAYLVDGMARVANLVDAPAFDAEVARNVKNVIAGATAEGDLFKNLSKSDTQWPLVVFFRAAMAYADRTGDASVYEAFAKHFKANADRRVKWGGRDRLAIEGMLKCAEYVDDPTLLEDAKKMYGDKGKGFAKNKNIINHGVSYSEDLKLPALLYLYTGDAEYLENGKKGIRNVFEVHEQASGQISCNEFTSGRDPRQGHEACVSADMMWSLGYYLRADGDVFAADRMERIAYNALPGHITKDFRLHQYLSTVNQVSPGPFSNNTHFNYAESAWRQYRKAHFPQCCTGNITRALPSFVSRMWMEDAKTGAPVAMLYGPCSLAGEYKGVKFRIVEETEYPFGDKVAFRLVCDEKGFTLPLRYRVPGWVKDGGRYAETVLKPGVKFMVDLAAPVKLNRDRNWCWFTRGPLTFCYAPEERIVSEDPTDPFSALRVETTGPWNYAIDADALADETFKVRRAKAGFPFETPALTLEVPAVEIREWQTLDQQRFMPDVPLYTHPTGRTKTLKLVPYATTISRITCFPDAVKRVPCPVVAGYTTGEALKFSYWRDGDFYTRTNACERWEPKQFTGMYKVPQRTPEIFFDLASYFRTQELAQPNKEHMAYILFRVWSDEDADATWCLGAANLWQAFADGKEVARSLGATEGLMMAPTWFDLPVKKGYNYLLVKVGQMCWWGQYRDEWGAKLDVFIRK